MSTDNFGGALVGWGEQIAPAPPDYVDSHRLATEDRVAYARLYWPERLAEDFDPIGTTGRKVVDRATGIQYVIAEHDPFQADKPEEDSIECFVQNGGWLWFLRRRGVVEAATAGVGLREATVAGVVENSGATLRDVETGVRRKWNKRKGQFE